MKCEKNTEAELHLKKQLPSEKHSNLCSSNGSQRGCIPRDSKYLKFFFLAWASVNVIADAYLNHPERLHQLVELLNLLPFK